MSIERGIQQQGDANFTPVQGDFKELKPFRFWCQKVLPLVYDDSLSYYELLCKVVNYLNVTMEDVETLHGDVDNLHTAYEELQDYVNKYFSSLDVQQEINNKLDSMVTSGEFQQLLEPYLSTFNTQVNNLQTQINDLVLNAGTPEPTAAEIAQARGGYTTLNDRLNEMVENKGIYRGTPSYTSLKQFPKNTLWAFTSAYNFDDYPNENYKQGQLYVLSGILTSQSNTSAIFQIFIATNASIYYRSTWDESTWSQWGEISIDTIKIKGNYSDSLGYQSLKDFPKNTMWTLLANFNFDDYPNESTKQGQIYTLSGTPSYLSKTSSIIQIFITPNGNLYYRTTWTGNTWSEWIELLKESITVKGLYKGSIGYTSLKDFPKNTLWSLTTAFDFDDYPNERYKHGQIYTLSGTPSSLSETSSTIQIFIALNGNLYYRTTWEGTTWSEWIELNNEKQENLNYLTFFNNFVCIGDSLTYSQVYTSSNYSRQAYVPYPKVLERKTGTPTIYIAKSGATPTSLYDYFISNIEEKDNACAILYLGTNYGLTDTISTDCADSDYNNWANTNTGNYGKMIRKLLDLNYKIILVEIYATNGNLTTTNNVINQFASMYNLCVVKNESLTDEKFHYYPDKSGANNLHYNDIGYSAFTSQLINNICSSETLANIIPE